MPAVLRARSFAALSVLLVAFVIATLLPAPAASAATRQQRISNAVAIAHNQIGDPYRYGAAGPGRFDCSGLLYYSFRRAGLTNIPRTSSAQARFADRIRKSRMRRGDLVFFHNGAATAGNVYHVGIFAGFRDGRRIIVHSPSTGKRVHRAPLWTNRWFAATLRGR